MKHNCERNMRMPSGACVLLALAAGIASASAAEAVNLFDPKAENLGWTFDNGREFPGAEGSLSAKTEGGKPTLVLTGDFTGGGNYVQMARSIDLDIDTFSFELKSDGPRQLTVRLVDAGEQCHQIVFAVREGRDWQRVAFPLRRFFENKGKPGAVAGVVRYENWGGAKDGKWRGPAKLIVLLANKSGDLLKREIAVRDFEAIVGAAAAARKPAGSPSVIVQGWVPLIDAEGKRDWGFSLGQEFPGAKGGLKLVEDASAPGKVIVRLTGDFSGGGRYVEAQRRLRWMGVDDMDRIRFRVRSKTTGRMSIRVGDGTGQTHQAKGALEFEADGEWHDVEVKLADLIGEEAWGGANDRKWHAPPQYITAIIGRPEGEASKTQQVVEFADVSVRSVMEAVQQASAYEEGFEAPAKLPAGWTGRGETSIVKAAAFEGERVLQLTRTLNNVGVATEAVGPAFAVVPGSWAVSAAVKSDLASPDNSFKGVLCVQMLDGAGRVIDQATIEEPWGKRNWQPIRKQVTVPAGAAKARFAAHLEKAHGSLWLDKLSASHLAAAQPQARRVLRVLFDMAQLGHLLYPGDSADVQLTVEAGPPLPDDARQVTYVVTDYWGAEQIEPRTATLKFDSRGRDGRRIYKTVLGMDGVKLDVGKYYEVHVGIPEPGGQTHRDFTTLAYLPEAVTRKYTWREVPFSSRNWDNRIPAYINLTDRLGIRLVGIWGGWRPDPPYRPGGPGVDLARKLGMSILISTPSNAVERHGQGWERWTHKPLYEGARAQVEAFGPEDRMAVTMGNEPPDVEGRAAEAVAAYKALYEGYKSINPRIKLVGTSVGTVESYFEAGMGKYLDAYDFHTYNDVGGIRKTFARYEALFRKYGHRKPIWSTEIGLNSQGVERRAVAGDMIRKFTTFFACGGENVSWFGLLYPDPQGKISGSASDSHNVFNCKYNCYSPRLDAISYYNMVNAICIRKFVEEKAYGDAAATLFRDADGGCLQVLWNNRQPIDAFVPLDGVGQVKHILIDGSITMLDAGGEGVTVRIGEDPILLLYEQKGGSLAGKLGEPRASIAAMPAGMVKGEAAGFVVQLGKGTEADDVSLKAPPRWSVRRTGAGGRTATFAVASPEETGAREGLIRLPIARGGKAVGLLAVRRRVRGAMTARLLPLPMAGGKAGVRIAVVNNSADAQQVRWKASLGDAFVMVKGKLNMEKPTEADAYFGDAAEGRLSILAHSTAQVDLPLLGVNPLATYTVSASVTDPQGRVTNLERLMGGFASAARADSPVNADGKLDEAAWGKAKVVAIDKADQYFPLGGLNPTPWAGPADCSAKVRMLWDDKNLYLGLEITDDILHQHCRGETMWQQDGVQLLIDPGRGVGEPLGKYDYSMGVGTEGPQVWCHLSATPTVPNGDVKDIIYAQVETGQGGNRTVEIAIPWGRIAPFKPAVGASLGMSIVINEDDKPMRNCYMNWFGDIMSKSTKANGDVILTD